MEFLDRMDEQRRLKRFLACEKGGVACVYRFCQNRIALKLVIDI